MADEESGAPAEADALDDEALWNAAVTGEAPAQAGDEPKDEPMGEEGEKVASQSEEAAEDIWAGASDAQRQAFEDLQHRYESDRTRFVPMSRKVNDLIAENRRLKTEQAQPGEVDKLKADLARVKEEFPEVGEVLDRMSAENDRRFASIDEASREAVLRRDAENEAAVEKVHPGFMQLLAGKKDVFDAWIDDQPRKIRDAYERNREIMVDAPEVVELVSAFKLHLNPPPKDKPTNPRRERQLAALKTPTARGRGAVNAPEADSADDDAAWAAAVAKAG